MIIKHNLNTAETKSLASTKGMKKYIVLKKENVLQIII